MLFAISLALATIDVTKSANELIKAYDLSKEVVLNAAWELRLGYRETQSNLVLYHWGDVSRFSQFGKPATQTDDPQFTQYLQMGTRSLGTFGAYGEFGPGIYLARNPMVARDYGGVLLTVVIPKGTPYLSTHQMVVPSLRHYCYSHKPADFQRSRNQKCKAAWIAAIRSLKIKLLSYVWSQGASNNFGGCRKDQTAFVAADPALFQSPLVMGLNDTTQTVDRHLPLARLIQTENQAADYRVRFPFDLGNPKPVSLPFARAFTFACGHKEHSQKTEAPNPDLQYPHPPGDPPGCAKTHPIPIHTHAFEEVTRALVD